MPLYKKILIAVDSSDEAVDIMKQAAEVIEAFDAEAEVVHVAQSPTMAYGPWGEYVPLLHEDQIQERLIERLNERKAEAGLGHLAAKVVFGLPVDTVVRQANEDNVDLIIVGSHGRHGIRLLLGSTANGILHHAGCDVLSVRIRETIDG